MRRFVLSLVLQLAIPCFGEINLVLLGGPGSGKGTLGKILARKYGLAHLSTGDMVRDHIKRGTPLGKQVQPLVEKGELLPDTREGIAPLVAVLETEIDAHPEGFVLEGFPRTAFQAVEFERVMGARQRRLSGIAVIDVADATIVRRLENRLNCPVCKRSYNIGNHAPKVPGRCDDDGAELFRRPDDVPEVILHRLEVFHRASAPIERFYAERGLLVRVDGERLNDEGLRPLFDHLASCRSSLAKPADFQTPADLKSPAELTKPADLERPSDLMKPRDLERPAHLRRPSDLRHPNA